MTESSHSIPLPGSALSQASVKVLLVEDDEDDVILTRRMLADIEIASFEMDWVADFDEGLRRLCSGHYDVCLVDYRLGPRDGVEFVREAVQQQCAAPIIILTGMGDRAVDLAAMNAGAADFLNKSELRPALLERSIRYSMQHRRSEEQKVRLLSEQAARARAEAANEAKDHFLAALSHELRTPLTPVLIAVDTLDEEPDVPPRVREAIDMIRRNVALEARLIDDMLDLTRVAHRKLELHRETVDIHAELRHAVQTCGHQSKEGFAFGQPDGKMLDFALAAEATGHHVSGDAARLQQVFWNLLKNATKFTPAGGRVQVRTYNQVLSAECIVIEVQDTGIGIEPDALPRIFNAFEQADQDITRRFGGLGLGLAICKAIVELHGGVIAVASEGRDRGTTFTVRLPTVPPPPEPAAKRRDPSEVPAARAVGRILLVEDHPDTRRLMVRLLERAGHRVSSADSVAAAIAAAHDGAFDLVISDIGLPDGSGLDLMRRLRELGPIKGIALSGFGMDHDVQRSEEAGFSEHLTKPVDLARLQNAVGRLLLPGR